MKLNYTVVSCTESQRTGNHTIKIQTVKETKTDLGTKRSQVTYYINGIVEPLAEGEELELDIEETFDVREQAYQEDDMDEPIMLKYLVEKS